MPILIDGHNLIGRLPTLSFQDPDDEEKLVRLLKSYRARTGKTLVVVFDSGGIFPLRRTRREGGIEVTFAPPDSDADALIVRRIAAHTNPQGWRVVTSDGRLAAAVARQGARVQSAEDFARELAGLGEAAAGDRDRPLSPQEVQDWLALFEGREAIDDVD